MLTFETLLNYLNIEQHKIEKLYLNENRDENNDENTDTNNLKIFDIPPYLLNLYNIFNNYFYIKIENINNSFLNSIMILLDINFIHNINKEIYINELRKKLCYDLEIYYRKFNYVNNKTIKKEIIQGNLLNLNIDLEESTKKYIVDYFGLNIYVFVFENNEYKTTNFYYSTNDNDEFTMFKPTILLLKMGKKYMPILNKKNEHILIHSKNKEFIEKLYEIFLKNNQLNKSINKKKDIIINENIIEQEDDIKNNDIIIKTNLSNIDNNTKTLSTIDLKISLEILLNKNLNKILLIELQTECKLRGIDINNEKNKPKQKKDLFNELSNYSKINLKE